MGRRTSVSGIVTGVAPSWSHTAPAERARRSRHCRRWLIWPRAFTGRSVRRCQFLTGSPAPADGAQERCAHRRSDLVELLREFRLRPPSWYHTRQGRALLCALSLSCHFTGGAGDRSRRVGALFQAGLLLKTARRLSMDDTGRQTCGDRRMKSTHHPRGSPCARVNSSFRSATSWGIDRSALWKARSGAIRGLEAEGLLEPCRSWVARHQLNRGRVDLCGSIGASDRTITRYWQHRTISSGGRKRLDHRTQQLDKCTACPASSVSWSIISPYRSIP